jgi:vacuolar-type H+-ATPase subunit E/Vma4
LLNAARAESEKTHTEILQRTRSALIDEAFERAKHEICDTDFGKYRELLCALLTTALLEQHRTEQQSIAFGDEVEPFERFEVLLNATDRERFGAQIVNDARRTVERRIGAEKAAKLTLGDETVDISGGLVLRFGDVELNCTLDVLMADIRRKLTPRVGEILFGEMV